MYNQAMMITKVKNIYIMLLHAISNENISMVDHYLDDELTKHFQKIIDNNIKNNVKQVFRQLNITNLSVVQEDEKYVTFNGLTRYITYFVDRKTENYIYGDNKIRISNNIILKFRKNDVKAKSLYRCPNCGAGLQINTTSICSYCDSAVDERFSPYVLCSTNLKV